MASLSISPVQSSMFRAVGRTVTHYRICQNSGAHRRQYRTLNRDADCRKERTDRRYYRHSRRRQSAQKFTATFLGCGHISRLGPRSKPAGDNRYTRSPDAYRDRRCRTRKTESRRISISSPKPRKPTTASILFEDSPSGLPCTIAITNTLRATPPEPPEWTEGFRAVRIEYDGVTKELVLTVSSERPSAI